MIISKGKWEAKEQSIQKPLKFITREARDHYISELRKFFNFEVHAREGCRYYYIDILPTWRTR